MSDLTKRDRPRKVAEAAVEYIVDRQETPVTTISSKNQITLPAHLLRELGLGPGDRLAVTYEDGRLILRARPKDWVSYHAGSLPGLYGKDAGEIEGYVKELRGEGDRGEEIEEAWSGQRANPQA